MLLTLDHPPVYTLGRRSGEGDLPMREEWCREQGIDVVATDRGGKLTYHGPGQLVGYPIMRIDDVLAYVRTMERAMIAALADERVHGAGPRGAHRRMGRRVEDRLDRGPRVARRDDARLRDQRGERPAARSPGSCPAACPT